MSEEARQQTGAGRGDVIAVPDVIDLQRMVERLERQQALLAEAQRLAQLGSWEWDLRLDRVTCSDELYRIFGRERGSLGGGFDSFLEFIHPEDRDHARAALEHAVLNGGAFQYEHRVVRPEGEVRTLLTKGRVHRDPEGEVVRVVGTGQDVTEWGQAALDRAARRAAEDAAQRSELLAAAGKILAGAALDFEETLRSVARLAAQRETDWCAVDLVDTDGRVYRAAVEHREPAMARLAHQLQALYPADPQDAHGIGAVIRTGRSQLIPEITLEMLRRVARDGEHLRLLCDLRFRSCMIVPLKARGETLGALTLVVSESERSYTEQDLRFAEELGARAGLALDNARLMAEKEEARQLAEDQAAELEMQAEELQVQAEALQAQTVELEDANATKANFLAVMSHELRTPLNAIAGYRELLDMGVHGPLTPAQRDALGRIEVNQRHLLRLINDVLNFARLEAGAVSYSLSDIEVQPLVQEIRSLVEPQVAAKELSYDCAGCAEGLRVRGDRARIEQILLNLLSNAVKFTQRGGQVLLTCGAEGDGVRFRVSDDGPGIPPEKWETVFDPFVQVGRGSGAENEGVGLGLAISRDLARALGGDLVIESSSPSGSTFMLSLPLA